MKVIEIEQDHKRYWFMIAMKFETQSVIKFIKEGDLTIVE